MGVHLVACVQYLELNPLGLYCVPAGRHVVQEIVTAMQWWKITTFAQVRTVLKSKFEVVSLHSNMSTTSQRQILYFLTPVILFENS